MKTFKTNTNNCNDLSENDCIFNIFDFADHIVNKILSNRFVFDDESEQLEYVLQVLSEELTKKHLYDNTTISDIILYCAVLEWYIYKPTKQIELIIELTLKALDYNARDMRVYRFAYLLAKDIEDVFVVNWCGNILKNSFNYDIEDDILLDYKEVKALEEQKSKENNLVYKIYNTYKDDGIDSKFAMTIARLEVKIQNNNEVYFCADDQRAAIERAIKIVKKFHKSFVENKWTVEDIFGIQNTQARGLFEIFTKCKKLIGINEKELKLITYDNYILIIQKPTASFYRKKFKTIDTL